jgi:uncharacterized membrane protein YdbT with pleckstrin-like domain
VSSDDKDLIANEKVHYVGRVSLWTQVYWVATGLLLIVISILWMPRILSSRWTFAQEIGIGIGVLILVVAYFRYLSSSVVITNKRVIVKSGILVRRTNELNIRKTESLQVEQSVAGRIFNYGSVIISGTGGDHAPIHGISNPQILRRAFAEAQNPEDVGAR